MREIRNIVFLIIIFIFIVILKGDINIGLYFSSSYVVVDVNKVLYAVVIISVITLIFGRIFCGWICIIAAFRNFFGRFFPDTNKFWQLKYVVILLILLAYYYNPETPENLYIRNALFFVAFGAVVFMSNIWCKNICPFGAFLSVVSILSIFRLKIGSKCKTCDDCNRLCDMGLKVSEEERMNECNLCYRCAERCPYNDISFSINPIYKKIIKAIKRF